MSTKATLKMKNDKVVTIDLAHSMRDWLVTCMELEVLAEQNKFSRR